MFPFLSEILRTKSVDWKKQAYIENRTVVLEGIKESNHSSVSNIILQVFQGVISLL